MDYIQEAKELVRGLDQRMGPSPYDIAWMARLCTEDGDPRWPDLIDWLLDNQHPDGSWGGKIEYYHDRIICTLIAIIALQENGHNSQIETAIERGERYLWHHMHLLPRDPFELSGFELIFPTLLSEARDIGLDVPNHTCGYGEIQTAKLRLIPPEMLYSPKISTVYSLEFLGQNGDVDRLQQAIASNYSLGNSPATTAYYSLLSDDRRALTYLQEVKRRQRIITVYPFRVFELGWVLNNLIYSGLEVSHFADEASLEFLHKELSSTGIALDPTFGVNDGDITSVCLQVLLNAGYEVDPLVLSYFEDKESHIFHTYDYERNISISTNIHALGALDLMPHYPDSQFVKEQVIVMLLNKRQYNIYWIDKWHSSPYYATAHALMALLREDSYLLHACHDTVDWIIHTQREDGSWGFFKSGTAEETAYALTALLHYNNYKKVKRETIDKGANYLARVYQRNPLTYPELWLAKSIYAPHDIIRSAILAALILYDETFG